MADDVRVTQDVIEIADINTINVRETQHVVEILSPVIIDARITQNAIEVLSNVLINTRISQDIIEVIMPGIPDVSGIYFINPKKEFWHDSYYADKTDPTAEGIERKIPDPTIKLPYLGE